MALQIMLAQQVLAVVVAVGSANDGVDVLARGLISRDDGQSEGARWSNSMSTTGLWKR